MKKIKIFSVTLIWFCIFILASTQSKAYDPPVGIPDPGFGIDEIRPERPSSWDTEVVGYYYINYQIGTDTGRVYGTPSEPRKTIPPSIPPGSYVELSGTYSYGGTTKFFQAAGTAENPVWLVGAEGSKPIVPGNSYFYGTYFNVDNIIFLGSASIRGTDHIAHHIAIRNCDIGSGETAAMGIVGTVSTSIHDIVVYNCTIHDTSINWDSGDGADTDYHGIIPGNYAYNIWILNNIFYNIAGNAVQIGGANASVETLNHVYVGHNTISGTRQSSLGIKKSSDVVISENILSDTHEWYNGASNYCAGISYQYAPQRLWVLNNTVYNADHGIKSGSGTSPFGDYVYIIGNIIYDIHNPDLLNLNGGWATGSGIRAQGVQHIYVVNNTIYNADHGITTAQQNMNLHIENNIVSDIDYNHIIYDSISTANEPYGIFKNNLIYQDSGNEVLRIASQTYPLAAYPYGSVNLAINPMFVDPINNDFHLKSSSFAKDSGIISEVYATFYGLYGIDIKKDLNGTTRPQGLDWDIGALEYIDGGATATIRADVDNSGSINTTDALLALRKSLSLSMTSTAWQVSFTTGDVDCNGVSNSTDALLILRYSLGLSMDGTAWCG